MENETRFYWGTAIDTHQKASEFDVYPYLPSKELIQAVQLSQQLGRPLLVKGEPGCGKSKLAEAIAIELHGAEFKKNYFEWNIKSTSNAIDGLYKIDYLRRLADANLRDGKKTLDIQFDPKKAFDGHQEGYISLGVIGKAFLASHESSQAPVVLIDEIDKADIDFPNDMLHELDKMEFTISEATKTPVIIKAKIANKPIIIITSNDEKALPAAFLRRCLFYNIDFKTIDLKKIALSRFPGLSRRGGVLEKAIGSFQNWRERIAQEHSSIKNISTSELLDWLFLIDNDKRLTENDIANGLLPIFSQALFKDVETIKLFLR